MKKLALVSLLLVAVALGAASVAAAPYRVLLVDGTKTLEATLRVGGLAGAMRQSGLADVSVVFTDAVSAYDDPLADVPLPAEPYDLVLIIPRGVGDGTTDIVWLLVGQSLAAQADSTTSLSLLQSGIGLAFGGAVRALTALDDLWAFLMSALYVSEGWLR